MWRFVVLNVLFLMSLLGCGGGGGKAAAPEVKPDPVVKKNTAPVLTVPVLQAFAGATLRGQLQATDAEQDPLVFQLTQPPAFGVLNLQANGSFSYEVPALLPDSAVSFSVTVSDGQLKAEATPIRISLQPSPGKPQPVPASYTVAKGQTFSGKLQAQMAAGEQVSYRIAKMPAGNFSADAAGNFIYTAPRQLAQDADSIEFQLDKNPDAVATIRFQLTAPQNQAPLAQPHFIQVSAGQPQSGQLSAVDPEGDPLSFALLDSAATPFFQLQSDGRYSLDASYQPGPAPLPIRFRVFDGNRYSAEALVTLLHSPAKGQPQPLAVQYHVMKGSPFSAQLPARFHPDDKARFVVYTKPQHGTFSVNDAGQFSYQVGKGVQASSDSFEFYLVYGNSSTALVKATLLLQDPLNTPPQTLPHTFVIPKGDVLQGQLLASDAENDVLQFSLHSAVTAGDLQLQPNGQFRYFADRNLPVSRASFEVKVSDGSLASYQTVLLELRPFVNKAPVIQAQNVTVQPDHFTEGQLLATDANQDPLTFSLLQAPAQGELQLQPDGRFRYIAPAQLTQPQVFSAQVSDGQLTSASMEFRIQPFAQPPALTGSSYRLFGAPGQVLTGTVRVADTPVVAGQPIATDLVLALAPRQGKVSLNAGQFSYQPASADVVSDRFVVQFTDAAGKPAQARIELDFQETALLKNDAGTAALAPEWQSAADFPPELKAILDGKDPFNEITDHSQATAYQALRALDTLALRGDSTDLLLYRLGYYLRSYYFHAKVDAEALWQPAQWPQLATVARHLQQIPGFYSTSLAGAQLQQVYSDVSYIVQYHSALEAERRQAMSPVLLAVSLYQRHNLTTVPYDNTSAFFSLMDYLDRLLYVNTSVSLQPALFERFSQLLVQLGTSQPLIEPGNSNPFWILNNLNNVATSLWYKSPELLQTQLVDTVGTIYRQALPAWSAAQQTLLRTRFFAHFLQRTVGYRQPETALNLCQGPLADVCLKQQITDVLPGSAQCGVPVRLTYDLLDSDQRQAVCGALDLTTSRFHQLMKTANRPLPDDHNDELEAVIFNSSRHYQDYAGILYGIDTNNGGLYLEGDPAEPQNQPRYFAYQQVTDGKWWVWNLEHEYTHYLDGRFIQKGDFSASQQMINSWWAEGLAEWVAWGEQFPRGFAVLRNTPAEKRPDLNTLFRNNYQNRDLTYHWSYALHYYLVKQQPALHLAMADCLKQGSAHCVRDLENRLMSEHSEPFARFVQQLVDRLNTPGAAADTLYNLQQFNEELQQLDAHSRQHLQQQSVPAQRPLRPAVRPDRELQQ